MACVGARHARDGAASAGMIAAMGRSYERAMVCVGARHARDGAALAGVIAAMGRSYERAIHV